ncbi:DUF3099 domain-containing protein [Frondihabitans australicus]|uniref:DUF3099 family protein n=1 Tax=Frondihabitans australicus TaxID=386892 RepID=A0A495IDU4_9MICO|nr:DUF3099 domain-containing protein [Frondihabitans australicus]RKR74173.1 hypothetical protein C8E83_1281 [Frondihabitans australicus]
MKIKSKKSRVTPLNGGSNTITSLPPAPRDEQRARMVRYAISMGIRTICVIAVFFVPGWWRLAPAIAAVVLPYFAVVIANAGHDGTAGEVERPGGVELYRPTEFTGYDPQGAGAAPHADGADETPRDTPAPPRPADAAPGQSGRDANADRRRRAQEQNRSAPEEPRVYYAAYAPGTEPRRAQPASSGDAAPHTQPESRDQQAERIERARQAAAARDAANVQPRPRE